MVSRATRFPEAISLCAGSRPTDEKPLGRHGRRRVESESRPPRSRRSLGPEGRPRGNASDNAGRRAVPGATVRPETSRPRVRGRSAARPVLRSTALESGSSRPARRSDTEHPTARLRPSGVVLRAAAESGLSARFTLLQERLIQTRTSQRVEATAAGRMSHHRPAAHRLFGYFVWS